MRVANVSATDRPRSSMRPEMFSKRPVTRSSIRCTRPSRVAAMSLARAPIASLTLSAREAMSSPIALLRLAK
jgi:hypothetical protein